MKVKTLRDLFLYELRDLYSAEKQLQKALPKMAKAATHEELKEAFEDHAQQTEGQVERLDQIFEGLALSPKGGKCAAMEGLVKEGQELMQAGLPDSVLDAALLGAAQRIEHHEAASYATARTYAEVLDEDEAADLLAETLDEEKETSEKLTELAEIIVTAEAESEDVEP